MPSQKCTLCEEGQSRELCAPSRLKDHQFQLSKFISGNENKDKFLSDIYVSSDIKSTFRRLNTNALVAISKQLSKHPELRTLIMDGPDFFNRAPRGQVHFTFQCPVFRPAVISFNAWA